MFQLKVFKRKFLFNGIENRKIPKANNFKLLDVFWINRIFTFPKNCPQQKKNLQVIENARKLNVRLRFYSKKFIVTFEEIYSTKKIK